MAKLVDTAYAPPDPLKSFVPGQSEVTAEAPDGQPPHGIRTLGAAVRHLFGKGQADINICGQYLRSDHYITKTSATLSDAMYWYVPPDTTLTDLEVWVYYSAVSAIVGGFKLFITGGDQPVELDTVAAGGDERIAYATWPDSGIGDVVGPVKITLQAKGTGVFGNSIRGCFVRRKGLTSIDDGTYYSGDFVPPDDVQVDEDEFLPLSADLLEDMRNGLLTLRRNRRKPYLTWYHGGSATENLLAVLMPLSYQLPPTLHVYSENAQTISAYGGENLADFDWNVDVVAAAATYASDQVYMSNVPYVVGENGVEFGQFVINLSDPASVATLTIEGL